MAASNLSNRFSMLSVDGADDLLDEAEEDSRSGSSKKKEGPLEMPLVWIDLEMTGLDRTNDVIIEIAVMVTDGDLERKIEGPEIVIHHSDEVMSRMNAWCVEQHGKSGLTAKVQQSTVSMAEAEQHVLKFIKQHVPYKKGVVAGNSVHVDIAFLKKDMPELADYFHYRIVDVSTIKELAVRWFPGVCKKAPRKRGAHTAMSDIKESLEELQFYRKSLFREKCRGGHKKR